MTQTVKQCNPPEEFESFIYEECSECGKHMTNIEDILVDENDRYICHECAEELNIKTIPCFDLCNYMCGD